MKQFERDVNLISAILSDCETLRSRVERFAATEESFVTDRSEEGKSLTMQL